MNFTKLLINHLKKLVLIPVVALSVLTCGVTPVKADSLNINASSCILIDAKTGQVLYEQNANEKVYPASTTKVMTALLALEKGDLNKLMVASQAAVNDIGRDGMNIGISAGEEIRLEDLMHALLIRSANETANIIAENLCSSRSEFVELMNKRAQELGATNTNFVNPCGKDSDKADMNHLTTAADMAKIARQAMTLPKFRELVSKKSFTMPDSNKHPASFWPMYSSTNKLLLYEKYKSNLFTVTGIKTGYTDKAGNNLISAGMNSDGVELISVILGVKNAPVDSVFAYTKTLLEYGFKNYSLQKLIGANEIVKNVPVVDAVNNARLDLVAEKELSGVLPLDKEKWNINTKEYIPSDITAPVKQGDILGYIEYERNGVSLGKVNVVAANAIEKSITFKSINTAKNTFANPVLKRSVLGVLITALAFMALRITLRRVSRMIRARKQERTDN